MRTLIARFMKDETGATAIEHGLIAALIAVAIIGGARALGTRIGGTFNNVSNAIKWTSTLAPRPVVGREPWAQPVALRCR
jgi:pilus assembly protein Flp/PilA